MSDLRPEDIVLADLESLSPWPGNPRRHDVEGLRSSVRRFGQQRVIVIQRSSGFIVAGHGIRMAMLAEGRTQGLVAYSDLDDTEAAAYLLADNQWGDRGYNDEDDLAAMLGGLFAKGAVDDALGFDSKALDHYLRDAMQGESDADDAPPAPRDTWVKPGDLFRLGRHRLICGDATDTATYDRLMGGAQADMIWTDPPYGVDIEGGTPEHLTIQNDAPDAAALHSLLVSSLSRAIARIPPGRAVYVAGPGGAMARVFIDVLIDLRVYRQTIVWVKDSLVMGRSDMHYRHEQIFLGTTEVPEGKGIRIAQPLHYGWRPGAAHWFVDDRTIDTVWDFPRPRRSSEHPTMKPVALVERSLTASSKRKQSVLDPFAGSGTTLIAAERTDRTCYAIELEPKYAQVIVERWQQFTGQTAEMAA